MVAPLVGVLGNDELALALVMSVSVAIALAALLAVRPEAGPSDQSGRQAVKESVAEPA